MDFRGTKHFTSIPDEFSKELLRFEEFFKHQLHEWPRHQPKL
jgi:hypothetical protein